MYGQNTMCIKFQAKTFVRGTPSLTKDLRWDFYLFLNTASVAHDIEQQRGNPCQGTGGQWNPQIVKFSFDFITSAWVNDQISLRVHYKDGCKIWNWGGFITSRV